MKWNRRLILLLGGSFALLFLVLFLPGYLLFRDLSTEVRMMSGLSGTPALILGLLLFAGVAGLGFKLISPRRRHRRWGALGLGLLALGLWALTSTNRSRIHFDPETGEPLKLVRVSREGRIELIDAAFGYSDVDGHQAPAFTRETAARVFHPQYRQGLEPADPAKDRWFSPYTGEADLYWSESAAGDLEFWKAWPGATHPHTGRPLEPVSTELHDRYRERHRAREQRDNAEAETYTAILSFHADPAGPVYLKPEESIFPFSRNITVAGLDLATEPARITFRRRDGTLRCFRLEGFDRQVLLPRLQQSRQIRSTYRLISEETAARRDEQRRELVSIQFAHRQSQPIVTQERARRTTAPREFRRLETTENRPSQGTVTQAAHEPDRDPNAGHEQPQHRLRPQPD